MKTGVFICHCGHNIKHTVDVEQLSEHFRNYPNVSVSKDYVFLCSEPGQELIGKNIANAGLDRVIIAACTPSLHGELFKYVLRKSNLNPFLLKRVGIREHCSWVGDDYAKNTEKAKRLILAGLYSAAHYVPLAETVVDVRKAALIVGGGIAGLSAALFLSRMGMQVYLVEKEAECGGQVRTLKNIWSAGKDGKSLTGEMIDELAARENVELFTSTTISGFEGFFGNYAVTLDTPAGGRKLTVGGVIIALGFSPFDPAGKPELNYGKDKRIITTLEFEHHADTLQLPDKPRVAILHCVGSRDEQIGKPYCSRVCCINALRVGSAIKDKYQDSYVESFYMDVRAHSRGGEEYFEDTQEKGVLFTRANVAEIIPSPAGVVVRGEDTLFGEMFEREFDLVVLSIGMSPPVDNSFIASLFRITLDKDRFFMEAHIKLRPFDTAVKGIFIAGSCSSPKDVEESINHGRAAAVKLFGFLHPGYTAVDPFISAVDPKRCSGCRMCEQACVAKAITYDETKKVVRVEEAACMGCGLCNSTCPSSAISLKGYGDSTIDDEISALTEARQ